MKDVRTSGYKSWQYIASANSCPEKRRCSSSRQRALEIMTACITYGLVQIRGLLQYRGDYSMKSVVFNFHKIEENKQSCSAYVFQVGNILIVSV